MKKTNLEENSKLPDMNKFPFVVPDKMPYTNNHGKTNNEKVRIVACLNCSYRMYCNMPAPICSVCNREMLTVIK